MLAFLSGGIVECAAEDSGAYESEIVALESSETVSFGKGGEKNFNGILTDLQMQTYLVIKDFRRKVNKRGGEYGMPVCVYSKPEDLWGYGMVSANYKDEPAESRQKIYEHLSRNYPFASGEQLSMLLK